MPHTFRCIFCKSRNVTLLNEIGSVQSCNDCKKSYKFEKTINYHNARQKQKHNNNEMIISTLTPLEMELHGHKIDRDLDVINLN